MVIPIKQIQSTDSEDEAKNEVGKVNIQKLFILCFKKSFHPARLRLILHSKAKTRRIKAYFGETMKYFNALYCMENIYFYQKKYK